MPQPDGLPIAVPADDTRGLGRLFVLIVTVEIVTIAALYWFGRHFV